MKKKTLKPGGIYFENTGRACIGLGRILKKNGKIRKNFATIAERILKEEKMQGKISTAEFFELPDLFNNALQIFTYLECTAIATQISGNTYALSYKLDPEQKTKLESIL